MIDFGKAVEAASNTVLKYLIEYLEYYKRDLVVALRNEVQDHLAGATVEPLLSVKDVADILNVSVRTVEDIIVCGELRPIWIGGQRRFRPEQVRAFLASTKRRKKGK